MRKFVGIFATTTLLVLAPAAANAQLGFILGLAIGSAASSGGENKTITAENPANVMYLMPGIIERVVDPLEIRIVASPCDNGVHVEQHALSADVRTRRGPTLRQFFAATVDNPERFEILQAVRVSQPDNTGCLRVWFSFIEKEKLRPLPLAQLK